MWLRLDNAAKISPAARTDNWSNVFRLSATLSEKVDKTALKQALEQAGIPAMVYYPIPLHMQQAYQDPRYKQGDFPIAEQLASCVLSLPMHTELDDEQLQYITTQVLNALNAQH